MYNYKYKLYAGKHTRKLSRLVTSSNFAWNHIVQFSRRYYRMYKKSLSNNNLQKHMAKLRKKDKFWSKLGSQTMQELCQRYEEAMNKHFKEGAGFPKTHKKFSKGSIVFKQGVGYSLCVSEKKNGSSIGIFIVNALGKNHVFKFKVTRPWGRDIRTVRVKKDTDGCLYLLVTCNTEPTMYERGVDNGPIGMDFGLKTFLTLSDGTSYNISYFTKENLPKTSAADRSYSLKRNAAVYGTNFRRAKKAKAKAHRRVKNLRSEFHWKLAHKLCREHSFIAIEDLNLKAMKKLWGRKVSNQGYGEFVQKLLVVARKYGTVVVKVDRFYASSQTCSHCGYKNSDTKDLRVREWVCPECGTVHDRDVNAAVNILKKALEEHSAVGTVN